MGDETETKHDEDSNEDNEDGVNDNNDNNDDNDDAMRARQHKLDGTDICPYYHIYGTNSTSKMDNERYPKIYVINRYINIADFDIQSCWA